MLEEGSVERERVNAQQETQQALGWPAAAAEGVSASEESGGREGVRVGVPLTRGWVGVNA